MKDPQAFRGTGRAELASSVPLFTQQTCVWRLPVKVTD